MSKKIVDILPVVLTDNERISKAKGLSKSLRTIATLEEAAKDKAAEFKQKIKAEKAVAGLLATEVETGKENRPVECYEVPNPENKTMELYRDDTGEFVRSRPMTTEDRQEHLPLSEVKLSKAKA